jgi:hypothetical protein
MRQIAAVRHSMQFFINCYAQNEIAGALRLCKRSVQRSESRIRPDWRRSRRWR